MLSTAQTEFRQRQESDRILVLNAVPVSFAQLDAALGSCAHGISPDIDGILGEALDARLQALDHWIATHHPARQSNAEAMVAAAARFPLSKLGHGIGFEPAGFQEMVLFIEELPW